MKDSDPFIRFDIFDRINSNSVKLNPQELRNAIYRGKLNDLIVRLSANKDFMHVRNVSEQDKRMQDCELILRFFAFNFNSQMYRSRYSSFLDKYLENGKSMSEEELKKHERVFLDVIEKVKHVFDSHAFRRYENKSWDKSVNRAVYDVIMLSFVNIEKETINLKKDEISQKLVEISQNPAFVNAVTLATKDRGRLEVRLSMWRDSLSSIGIDIPTIQIGQPLT